MKILKLSPYFYPEQVSSSHLTNDLNEAFAKAGIIQENYVPMPSRGVSDEVRKEYKNKKTEVLNEGTIVVHRFPMIKEGKNTIQRALKYILTNMVQYHKGKNAKGIDVIFGASTPPTQGVLCAKVKKKLCKRYEHYVPFIYNLQDIFPDSLVNAKMTTEGSLIWKIGRKIEDYTYKNADLIIVIGEGIKSNILRKGVPADKIVVIPNWIDTNAVKPITREENTLFSELKLQDEMFYVTYAGNMGTAQGIDTILDAAEVLCKEKNIQFIIFGGGSKSDLYKKRIIDMDNVKLFPLQPPERVSEVYSLGDVSIVACKRGVGNGAIPSKTFSIMATGTPVVLSFDKGSELWNLIEANDCGYLSDADDSHGLAKEILNAYNNRDAVRRKGDNALALVKQSFSKDHGTQEYIRAIREVNIKTRNGNEKNSHS